MNMRIETRPWKTLTLVAVAAFFALAAPSFADPGQPGLGQASQAVYPNSGVGGVTAGGGGGDEGDSGATAGDEAVAAAVSSEESGETLPFTGLSAPIMLLAGLITLALGLALRTAVWGSQRALSGPNGR
jgi:hypothetical protein